MQNTTHPLASFQSIDTASDLRRKLHAMKYADRNAVMAAQTQPGTRRFLQSSWAMGLLTGLSVWLALYLMNPHFVQEKRERYDMPRPNMRKVGAWSLATALFVALGPLAYQKFTASK